MIKPFTFQTVPNILFEVGGLQKAAEIVAGFTARSAMLVTDKGVRNAGLTQSLEADLSATGIALTVFDDVLADPPSFVIEKATDLCRAAQCELVIAVGGGSAMDTAKLVAYLAKSPEPLEAIYGVGNARGQRLPLILAPTTAGTGSEVTPIAIVTTPSTEKKGVVSPRLLPDWAILDPELTLGLPAAVTAATGIDAMVHAIEAYTSRHRKNPLSDNFARQAMSLLSPNLRKACELGGDIQARSAMLLGSMLAGMAFANAPVAAVHALAYPIGAPFHVPHGLSNALVNMALVMRFNASAGRTLEYSAELGDILRPAGSPGEPTRNRALRFVSGDGAALRGLRSAVRSLGHAVGVAGSRDILDSACRGCHEANAAPR